MDRYTYECSYENKKQLISKKNILNKILYKNINLLLFFWIFYNIADIDILYEIKKLNLKNKFDFLNRITHFLMHK